MIRWLYFGLSTLMITFSPNLFLRSQGILTGEIEITSPSDGEAVRGMVVFYGNIDIVGFLSWELAYSYFDEESQSWFLIDEGGISISENKITEWDTTIITDGNYDIRLTVNLEDGQKLHFILKDLRVRNYSSIETLTPTPTDTITPLSATSMSVHTATVEETMSSTPEPTLDETPTLISSQTSLPTNPLEISTSELSSTLLKGVAGSIAVFLAIGLYFSFRKVIEK